MSWTRDEFLDYISPTGRERRRLMDDRRPAVVALIRKYRNRQRVADHFDRLNAQGIALGSA